MRERSRRPSVHPGARLGQEVFSPPESPTRQLLNFTTKIRTGELTLNDPTTRRTFFALQTLAKPAQPVQVTQEQVRHAAWERSTLSQTGVAVEVAELTTNSRDLAICMRKADEPDTALVFDVCEWTSFLLGAHNDEFDRFGSK